MDKEERQNSELENNPARIKYIKQARNRLEKVKLKY
jgi:hypothetical protein